MKVYILKFSYHIGGLMGGHDHHETLGTYATEEGAKKELQKIKDKFLSQGSGYKVQDAEDGKGFCGYHEMGSMSFAPGWWKYEEQEVIE